MNAIQKIVDDDLPKGFGYDWTGQSYQEVLSGNAATLLMVLSILLAYVVYSFIYVVFYLLDTQFVEDTKLIFFLVTSIAPILLCIGLMAERKRVTQLAELHKTREELKALYGDDETKTTIPFETVVFKFEQGKTY